MCIRTILRAKEEHLAIQPIFTTVTDPCAAKSEFLSCLELLCYNFLLHELSQLIISVMYTDFLFGGMTKSIFL